jgi:hypothetical protein
LEDVEVEAPPTMALEPVRAYVFFLQLRPGGFWRVMCPFVTLAEVVGDELPDIVVG